MGEKIKDLAYRDGFRIKIVKDFELKQVSMSPDLGHLYADGEGKVKEQGNPQAMFKYFDKNYDLSSPRKFFVYQWEWV